MKKESTMKVQREMELSEYNRKGILKSVSRQKPSEAFNEYCRIKYNRSLHNRSLYRDPCWGDDSYPSKICMVCRDKWIDKHCTYNGASRKARRMK